MGDPSPMDQIAHRSLESTLNLTIYGPLGVLALLAIFVAVKLYFDARKDRATWQAQLNKEREECQKERKEHQDEMKKLEERYIAKAENALEKYHALAESLNRVLDSATRRYPRSSGGQSGQAGDT